MPKNKNIYGARKGLKRKGRAIISQQRAREDAKLAKRLEKENGHHKIIANQNRRDAKILFLAVLGWLALIIFIIGVTV